MSKDNGGPAFPAAVALTQGNKLVVTPESFRGMTLRDYFAAKAMQGELAAMQDPEGEVCGVALDAPNAAFARLAAHWYRIADAMLKERAK